MKDKKQISQEEAKQMLSYRIREEGIDYSLRYYSNWEEIESPEFHKLREEYIKLSNKIKKFAGLLTD